jgi:hypothetical protein
LWQTKDGRRFRLNVKPHTCLQCSSFPLGIIQAVIALAFEKCSADQDLNILIDSPMVMTTCFVGSLQASTSLPPAHHTGFTHTVRSLRSAACCRLSHIRRKSLSRAAPCLRRKTKQECPSTASAKWGVSLFCILCSHGELYALFLRTHPLSQEHVSSGLEPAF